MRLIFEIISIIASVLIVCGRKMAEDCLANSLVYICTIILFFIEYTNSSYHIIDVWKCIFNVSLVTALMELHLFCLFRQWREKFPQLYSTVGKKPLELKTLSELRTKDKKLGTQEGLQYSWHDNTKYDGGFTRRSRHLEHVQGALLTIRSGSRMPL